LISLSKRDQAGRIYKSVIVKAAEARAEEDRKNLYLTFLKSQINEAKRELAKQNGHYKSPFVLNNEQFITPNLVTDDST